MIYTFDLDNFFLANRDIYNFATTWFEGNEDLVSFDGINFGLSIYVPLAIEISSYKILIERDS